MITFSKRACPSDLRLNPLSRAVPRARGILTAGSFRLARGFTRRRSSLRSPRLRSTKSGGGHPVALSASSQRHRVALGEHIYTYASECLNVHGETFVYSTIAQNTGPTTIPLYQQRSDKQARSPMIVEHDGGWAYRVGAVFSRPSRPTTWRARRRSAQRRSKWFRRDDRHLVRGQGWSLAR